MTYRLVATRWAHGASRVAWVTSALALGAGLVVALTPVRGRVLGESPGSPLKLLPTTAQLGLLVLLLRAYDVEHEAFRGVLAARQHVLARLRHEARLLPDVLPAAPARCRLGGPCFDGDRVPRLGPPPRLPVVLAARRGVALGHGRGLLAHVRGAPPCERHARDASVPARERRGPHAGRLLRQVLEVVATFVVVSVLWALWSASSIRDWLSLLWYAGVPSGQGLGWMVVAGAVLLVYGLAGAFLRPARPGKPQARSPFLARWAGATAMTLAL